MHWIGFSAAVAALGLAASPAAAATPDRTSAELRPGAFVGARVQLRLGGPTESRPRAALTIAPTNSRVSDSGMLRTRIGEGLALNLTPRARPTLTLAGVRADAALNLQRQGPTKTDNELGISTGGWVAIGVGTVVVVGAVAFALWVDAVNDSSD